MDSRLRLACGRMSRGPMPTIHVELLDEGVECWRPVEAEHLVAEVYRITGASPAGETWAFNKGDVVRCRPYLKQGDHGQSELVLVATESFPSVGL